MPIAAVMSMNARPAVGWECVKVVAVSPKGCILFLPSLMDGVTAAWLTENVGSMPHAETLSIHEMPDMG